MKKIYLFICFLQVWSLIYPAALAANVRVGISLPTQNEERYYRDGYYLKAALEKAGFEADLFYGGDGDVPTQCRHIRRLLNEGCKILVIGAVNAESLGTELQEAKARGAAIIAYDVLLMNTPDVDYYVTFNNEQAGMLMANYLERKLKLAQATPADPVRMEFFAGSPSDIGSQLLWDSAMNVLMPYIQKHTLMAYSGELSFFFSATESWDSYPALQRMERLIKENDYRPGGKKLNAVLSPTDTISEGIMLALDNAGYKGGDNYPLITGQYCHAVNIHSMLEHKQTMSMFKDGKLMGDAVVKMVQEIAAGRQVEVTNTVSYNNGKKIVPAIECDSQVVDIDNYKRMLVDSGFMTEEKIKFPYR